MFMWSKFKSCLTAGTFDISRTDFELRLVSVKKVGLYPGRDRECRTNAIAVQPSNLKLVIPTLFFKLQPM